MKMMAFALGIVVGLAGSVAIILGQGTNSDLKHLMVPIQNGGGNPVRLSARSVERGVTYPSVVELKGNVEIQTPVCLPVGRGRKLICDGNMVVHADEAKLHEDTGEIEATGTVIVIPLRHETKH